MPGQQRPAGRGDPDQVVKATRRLATASAFALLLGLPSVSAAQQISGTVRETEDGPLIAGGFVSLLDHAGEAVQADFTAADGAFSLRAPRPGVYRIRVERIGYANWLTDPYRLEAGRSLTVTVEVPPRPVRLGDLRVEVAGSCLDDPTEGVALATVWEEARKALETAVWAEGRDELTFTLTRWERIIEPASLATRRAESRTYRNVRLPPFEGVPIRRLMTRGYAVMEADSTVYYAPDATALLSQEFRDTHCFGLRREQVGSEPMLGVTFRPRNAGAVVQIEGTVWLDERSAELRSVRLRYLHLPLPRDADRRLVGAELVFDRLPDGPFYVRDWWIRFPLTTTIARLGRAVSADRSAPVLVGYMQMGGSVQRAAAGGIALDTGEGIVTGIVRDSVSGEPLAGAEIVLRDWEAAAALRPAVDAADTPFSAISNEDGEFLVGGLPDGAYALRIDHQRFRTAGVALVETRVVVEDRTGNRREFWTPSAETLFARTCPGLSTIGDRGAVVGIARDASGVPVPGAEIEITWRVRRLQQTRGGGYVTEMTEGERATSDEQGRFAICGVPLGEPVLLRPRGATGAIEYEQTGRIMWRDVPVQPDPPGASGAL